LSAIIIANRIKSEDQNIVSVQSYGDFEVVFTYMDDDEPVMLFRPKRFLSSRRCCYGVALGAAYKYYDKDAGAAMFSAYAVETAAKMVMRMGLNDTKRKRYEVCEAVLESLDDLIKMPPRKAKAPDGDHVEGTVRIGDDEYKIDTHMEGTVANSSEHMTKVDNPLDNLIK
jgi:hypothetical protein